MQTFEEKLEEFLTTSMYARDWNGRHDQNEV